MKTPNALMVEFREEVIQLIQGIETLSQEMNRLRECVARWRVAPSPQQDEEALIPLNTAVKMMHGLRSRKTIERKRNQGVLETVEKDGKRYLKRRQIEAWRFELTGKA